MTVHKQCNVFALLDSGSGNSFCSRALVRQLGITSEPRDVQLSTLNKSGIQKSEIVDLLISSESRETLDLSAVYVVNEIPVKNAAIDISSHVQFHGIGPMPAYEHGNVVVDLLTGQDNTKALVPLDVRRGNPGQPFAVRTLVGVLTASLT